MRTVYTYMWDPGLGWMAPIGVQNQTEGAKCGVEDGVQMYLYWYLYSRYDMYRCILCVYVQTHTYNSIDNTIYHNGMDISGMLGTHVP